MENKNVDRWLSEWKPSCSERVLKARNRTIKSPEICLEYARCEMAVLEENKGKNVPRIKERAQILDRYLRTRTLYIMEDELIVGNVNSKLRGSIISGELYNVLLEQELNDPKIGFDIRDVDRHDITPEEKKELNEVIIPYFHGKTMEEKLFSRPEVTEEIRQNSFGCTSKCPHIPNAAEMMVRQDAGHMLANYEKVLKIGLLGIREEVVYQKEKNLSSYIHYEKEKRDLFYESALICIDAALAMCERYADLAAGMAEKESDPKRKKELERISANCRQVPAHPARDWWEALQSIWMVHVLILCEQRNYGDSMGRLDQYLYPYYKKSVLEEKTMTRDEAIELMELLLVKMAEQTELYDYGNAKLQPSMNPTLNVLVGGQTRDGKDACNEVTELILEADMEVGLISPELAFRVWEGTPEKYLMCAARSLRLGRGKPKFYGDKCAIQMEKNAYPGLTTEDARDYAVIGCVEIGIPHITQQHSFTGLTNLAKIMDVTIHNGKCSICGQQIGPQTGDVHDFKTFEEFKEAFRKQVFYWTEYLVRGVKVEMDNQAEFVQSPLCSCLLEGPIQKGKDLIEGGAWYTGYGLLVGGTADTGDAFTAIEKLIYEEKRVSWDEMLKALDDNWQGHDRLLEMCRHGVPKYGNDIDEADANTAYGLNCWLDSIEYVNTRRDLIPKAGGSYRAAILIGNGAVAMGNSVGALPNGRPHPAPLADTTSPVQGMDVNGTTAAIKSASKLPQSRFTMGTALNQRFSPQLMATEDDLKRFCAYLKTLEELGVFHCQFNVISSALLHKAMKEPDKYRDLLVRVSSFVAYFVELDAIAQMDIVNRTEHETW